MIRGTSAAGGCRASLRKPLVRRVPPFPLQVPLPGHVTHLGWSVPSPVHVNATRVVGVPWKGKVSHGEQSGRCVDGLGVVDGDGRACGDVVALADGLELCGARHSRLVRYLGRGFGNEATVGRGFGGRLGGYPVEKRCSGVPGGVAAVAAGSAMVGRDSGMAHPTGDWGDHVGFREKGDRRALCHYPGLVAGRLGHEAGSPICAGPGGSDRGQKRPSGQLRQGIC